MYIRKEFFTLRQGSLSVGQRPGFFFLTCCCRALFEFILCVFSTDVMSGIT